MHVASAGEHPASGWAFRAEARRPAQVGDGTPSPRLGAQCSQASPAGAPPCLDIFQTLY